MSWIKGFDFRQNPPGSADPNPNNTYVTPTDAYDTLRNGVHFGWTPATSGAADGRDRDASGVPELNGICFNVLAVGVLDFRVDLPAAGQYIIRVAFGDSYTVRED